jgi:hypothetical protein
MIGSQMRLDSALKCGIFFTGTTKSAQARAWADVKWE